MIEAFARRVKNVMTLDDVDEQATTVLLEEQKRNILGGNAQRLFNLEPIYSPQKLARRAAGNGKSWTSDAGKNSARG